MVKSFLETVYYRTTTTARTRKERRRIKKAITIIIAVGSRVVVAVAVVVKFYFKCYFDSSIWYSDIFPLFGSTFAVISIYFIQKIIAS
ncbi:MAG TPA: hypothetical protein VFJ05_03540 [Nitrososphaeraceae archaeon]|nr:hypothetical protein [Nitrososphaeraceae archaeon]